MEMIVNLVTWVTIIVTVASLIAASTPTPKDDAWIGKLYKLVDWEALNIGRAKEKEHELVDEAYTTKRVKKKKKKKKK